MSRRNARGGRRGSGSNRASLFELVLALSAGRPVFNADLYMVDGGSGKVRSIVDWNDASHLLDQANTTLQCALPVGHADYANKLCLTFTGAEWYRSNRAATTWNHTVNGNGITYCVQTPTALSGVQIVAETDSGGAGGSSLRWNGGTLQHQLFRGATQLIGPSGATNNVPLFARVLVSTLASPWRSVKFTGVAASTAASPAGSDVNCTLSLTVGGRSGVSSMFLGRVREWIFTPETDLSSNLVAQYALQTYGIAA